MVYEPPLYGVNKRYLDIKGTFSLQKRIMFSQLKQL